MNVPLVNLEEVNDLLARRTTAGPPKALRPVLVKFLEISTKFCLKLFFQVFGFFLEAMAPACAFLVAVPGDELEAAFMEVSVLAFAKLVVPQSRRLASLLVCRPVASLAISSWEMRFDG